jgi:UMF1 family MFS transporter
MKRPLDRAVASWALYDWANSAFSTTVMAGFVPVLFKHHWNVDVDAATSSFRLGLTNSLASLVVALIAPALGAIADAGGTRKRFLLAGAGAGILATAGLYFVGRGEWAAAAAVYSLGVVGFSASMVFYDAMLVDVATPAARDRVSALGFALGYLGGGVLFALNVFMTQRPSWFGLADATEAARWSFLTVALWWALFTLPLIWNVRERPAMVSERAGGGASRRGLRQIGDTFHHLRAHRDAFVFLLGYWLYIDGVHTIVRMAVDYGISLGFDSSSLILALLLTQFVGFPAALAFGRIGERIGARSGIMIAIASYALICVWGYRLAHIWEFYALAAAIGLVQGGINSLSRSMYSRLIPGDRSAQFFGYYNTVGRFSAVLGPVFMGWVSVATGNPRLSMLGLILFFVAGGLLLARVRERPLSSPS